jgi:hypothetical protein
MLYAKESKEPIYFQSRAQEDTILNTDVEGLEFEDSSSDGSYVQNRCPPNEDGDDDSDRSLTTSDNSVTDMNSMKFGMQLRRAGLEADLVGSYIMLHYSYVKF